MVVPFGAGLATFVVLTACQTAVGRLHLGTAQALASRYSIGSFAFWLALMRRGDLPLIRDGVGSVVAGRSRVLSAARRSSRSFVGYRTLPVDAFLPTSVFGTRG